MCLFDILLGWMVYVVKSFFDGKSFDGFGIKVDDWYMMLYLDLFGL